MTATQRQPPLRDFADRGTTWLLESPENLRGLVGLLEAELAERLDFSRAKPDNRPMVTDDLDKRQSDIVFRVPYKEGRSHVWVCVLLEHQSSPDPYLGFRLLRYMVGIWGRQLRKGKRSKRGHCRARIRRRLTPIIPIVFYTGQHAWTSPISVETVMEVPGALSRFVPRHDTLFLNLDRTSPDQLVGSAIAAVLRVIQVERAPLKRLEEVLASAVQVLDDLPEEMGAERREALYYLLLLVLHRRAPEEQERLVTTLTTAARKHRREVEKMKKMSAVETWKRQGHQDGLREGHRDGLREGLRDGLREGLREGLLRLLQIRFGPLPQHLPPKLQALTIEELQALFDKAATATSLADLELGD